MPVITTGPILNQHIDNNCPIGNPMEGEKFEFQVIYVPPPSMITEIGLTLIGDIPGDLKISPTGLISGTLKKFENQIPTAASATKGDAVISENGNNCFNNGRPKINMYMFNFMVVYNTIVFPGTSPIPLTEMSGPITITLMHNYTMDNEVFIERYEGDLDAETQENMRKV
jgi:hypothetical protein